MPIVGDIKQQTYSPQIRGFTPSLADNTLKATFEYVQASFLVRFFWYAEPQELFFFNNAEEIKRTDGKKWGDDGFRNGDSAVLQFGLFGTDPTSARIPFTILQISEDGSTLFTDLNITTFNNNPIRNEELTAGYEILVAGLTNLNNARFSFGLNENKETFNVKSKLTGEDQSYLVKNILGVPTSAEIAGSIRGWSSVNMPTFKKNSNSTIPLERGANFGESGGVLPDCVQNIEITHTLPILPFYVAGGVSDLKNNVLPDFLKGDNSLSYRFKLELSDNISSSNFKTINLESAKGSVGYFGENFNGLQTQYSLVSNNYTVGGQSNVSCLANGITNVTAIVKSDEGTFTGTQSVVVVHSYLPEFEEEYTNKETYFEDNFLFESIVKGNSGNIVKNVTTTLIDTFSLQINFDIDTSGIANVELTENSNYILYVVLDDNNKTANNSDRTAIILDINNYDKNPDIPDLFFVNEMLAYDHVTDDVNTGFTDAKGWVQDGYEVKGSFKLDRTKFAILENFFIEIVAWKDGTNEYFTIQSNQFGISGAIVDSNGNQQIFVEDIQGFQLDELDQFNKKVLTTGVFDGTFINYNFALGLKINWQDWLSNPNVDPVFFNENEPNFGLNQNASRYSLKEGYTLFTIIRADILEEEQGITTEYIHKLPMDVNDFEEDAIQDWEAVIITQKDENGVDVNGKILQDQSTRIKAVFTPNFAITPDPEQFEGVIRIVEQTPQSDKTIHELSSVRSSYPNNLLIPIEGEALTKVSTDGTSITLECRTREDLIQDVNYTVSARIYGGGEVIIGEFNDDFSNDFFN